MKAKDENCFLSQTDFIQFLTTSPPPQAWAKRFAPILKKTQKSDFLRNFLFFVSFLTRDSVLLFFWINILRDVFGANAIFWKVNFYFFWSPLKYQKISRKINEK